MGYIERALTVIDQAKNNSELAIAKNYFVGAFFEDMAYKHVQKLNPGIEIYGPKRTYEYYAGLVYPEIAIVDNNIIGHSLRGITVPDGLSFNSFGLIDTTYHYTCRREIGNLENMYGSMLVHRDDRPEFFSQKLTFAIATLRGVSINAQTEDTVQYELPLVPYEFRKLAGEEWKRCLRQSTLVLQ